MGPRADGVPHLLAQDSIEMPGQIGRDRRIETDGESSGSDPYAMGRQDLRAASGSEGGKASGGDSACLRMAVPVDLESDDLPATKRSQECRRRPPPAMDPDPHGAECPAQIRGPAAEPLHTGHGVDRPAGQRGGGLRARDPVPHVEARKQDAAAAGDRFPKVLSSLDVNLEPPASDSRQRFIGQEEMVVERPRPAPQVSGAGVSQVSEIPDPRAPPAGQGEP